MSRPLVRPLSPHRLVQEFVQSDPWKVLVSSVLCCGPTSPMIGQSARARPAAAAMFRRWPRPHDLGYAGWVDLHRLLTDAGVRDLRNRRVSSMRRLSRAYDGGGWADVAELPCLGEYHLDAWRLFVVGDYHFLPSDRELGLYARWLRRREGA